MAQHRSYGYAWLALCLALLLHIYDETVTNFLVVYNPAAMAIRQHVHWLPVPVFQWEVWLGGLIMASLALLALTVFAFGGARWLRPIAYIFAAIMVVNALGHFAGTIVGRGLFGQVVRRPMPGFWSSPVLLATAIYLIVRLRRTREDPTSIPSAAPRAQTAGA